MKKLLALILTFVFCCSLFCSCISKSAVIGVWENEDKYSDYRYMYIYKDGTVDFSFDSMGVSSSHSNSGTWRIEGDYLVLESSFGSTGKYTVKGNSLYNSRDKLAYTKVSDDPTVDMDLDWINDE